jgi:hypothetical protein
MEDLYMAKNTKIYSDFLAKTKDTETTIVVYNFGEQSFDVSLKTEMTIDEKSALIDRVVNGCFDGNNEFRPEFRDAIFQITVLQMLSDVPVFTKKVDEVDEEDVKTGKKIDIIDIDKTYELCKKLDLFHKANDAFRALINELVYLIETKIVFEQQRIIAGERVMLQQSKQDIEKGIEFINGVAQQLTEGLSNTIKDEGMLILMNEFAKKHSKLTDAQILQKISADN